MGRPGTSCSFPTRRPKKSAATNRFLGLSWHGCTKKVPDRKQRQLIGQHRVRGVYVCPGGVLDDAGADARMLDAGPRCGTASDEAPVTVKEGASGPAEGCPEGATLTGARPMRPCRRVRQAHERRLLPGCPAFMHRAAMLAACPVGGTPRVGYRWGLDDYHRGALVGSLAGPAGKAIVISVPALAGRTELASDLVGRAASEVQGALGPGASAPQTADCRAATAVCRPAEIPAQSWLVRRGAWAASRAV